MQQSRIKATPLILASFLALAIAAVFMMRGAEASGATLLQPMATCNAAGASVTLGWVPVNQTANQWIEYSYQDNGFAEGTYNTVSLSPGQNRHTLRAQDTAAPHYWRVVTATASGDVASRTGVFVPCDGPVLLWGPMECSNYDWASVSFRWAPVAGITGKQHLEFDLSPAFDTDAFRTTVPLSPGTSEHRESGFQDSTMYYFRAVLVKDDGTRLTSQVARFMPECRPNINPEIYDSTDRLVIPSIGVNAPIAVQDVGWGSLLNAPDSGHEVVRYNFAAFPGLNGVPGGPGPKLIAGHLDYYVIGPAVFWDLRHLQAGDTIQYWVGDELHTYVVQWNISIDANTDLNPYLEQAEGDSLLLITCNGIFDRELFGGYNERTLIYAVRA